MSYLTRTVRLWKSEADFTEITESNSFGTPSLIVDMLVVKTRVGRKRKKLRLKRSYNT